jgi:hypothetical protein
LPNSLALTLPRAPIIVAHSLSPSLAAPPIVASTLPKHLNTTTVPSINISKTLLDEVSEIPACGRTAGSWDGGREVGSGLGWVSVSDWERIGVDDIGHANDSDDKDTRHFATNNTWNGQTSAGRRDRIRLDRLAFEQQGTWNGIRSFDDGNCTA